MILDPTVARKDWLVMGAKTLLASADATAAALTVCRLRGKGLTVTDTAMRRRPTSYRLKEANPFDLRTCATPSSLFLPARIPCEHEPGPGPR